MRICSLLPSATETLFALGLGEELVGVTHECAFPPDACQKPRVIQSLIQHEASSPHIDRMVRESLAQRRSVYRIDEPLLRRLAPDLVITQELCEVCALDAASVRQVVAALPSHPTIVSLHAHTVAQALDDILQIGHATEHLVGATRLVASLRARIEHVRERVAKAGTRPRVLCLEWMDPLMTCGHWVPEMVELAGGREVLGQVGQPSRRIEWTQILEAQPEQLILMPCGFSIERIKQELPQLCAQPGWYRLPAVQEGLVFLVNGPAYFNQSGPRLVDGIEVLAGLFHPECAIALPQGAAERWQPQLDVLPVRSWSAIR